MDATKCRALADLCDALTTSGEPHLDQKKMKEIKKICRISDVYVSQCYELLWSQLKREHSEIRLSTFQIIDELFTRSHKFRCLLLENFQSYLELTLEIDLDQPLPPPQKAAETLKNSAYQALRKWHEAYSVGYRKLELAFNYLRNCHQVDFNKADHQSALSRQREQEAKIKADAAKKRVIDKVLSDVNDQESDIQSFVTQLSTCFKLLIPSQDVFDVFDDKLFTDKSVSTSTTDKPDSESPKLKSDPNHAMQEHGLLNRKAQINININQHSVICENEENTDIIHNLDELKVLLTVKYIPLIVRWLATLQRLGASQDHLTRLIDLKQHITKTLKDLDVLTIHRIEEDDEDDNDLLEVPEDIDEVAFFKSRLGMTGQASKNKTNDGASTSGLKQSAPVLDYDLDLEYWENPEDLKVPQALPNDAARFWVSQDRSYSVHDSLQELYSSRRIDFSGKFVPVKWTCRAPLASGRLCPRMDRVKCPFHGKILARNNDGSPASPADAAKLARIQEKQRKDNPEWQDPSLLADIEAQTGLDLKVEKSKRGKQKSKLTNINKASNPVRNRLESKVLSRSAMKRVAGAMNRLDQKRMKDKFCHSFLAAHS